jgi:HlyD family secretion protein
MKSKKIIPVVVVVVLLIVAVLIKFIFFKNDFSYAGTVEVTKVDIPARVMSVIAEFPAKEGQVIKKGQLLVGLSCEDILIAYDLAKTNYDRAVRLFKSGNISRENYDEISNKKQDLELKKNWCRIEAPLTGTVLTTYFEPGEMVVSGSKVLTMGDLEEVYAYFYLPHDEMAKLKMNQEVQTILPEMKDKKFPGVIEYINPEAEFTPKNVQTRDERTRLVYGVKVRFKNPEGILKPGMTLEWH